jgi:hypothetical protein
MNEKRKRRSRELSPRRCVGHMEREPGRLQLRLVLYRGEHVCEIDIEEDDEVVVAFATVCGPAEEDYEDGDACEVPCHVYLECPLGDRAVRDGHFGHAIPYRNVYAELEATSGPRADPETAQDPA